MSTAPPPSGRRATRTAAAVAGLLVLLLVAVLVGLLRPSTEAGSPASTASVRASAASSAAPTTDPESGLPVVALADLPAQARETVALIEEGGPFPYAQDGQTFGNYEKVLPPHARGWYREYTVRTPGERDRGPRRIVTGDDDRLIFYTADHYATFVRVLR